MVCFEHIYRDVKVVVATGDITKQKVDAIVNPANSQLIMGGGVAGAIKKAGGREIEEEAVEKAPVQVGKAVATGGGRLKAKYVIHAPTMERPAMRIGAENINSAMKGALECAERLRISSISFPGMGTGVGGLQIEEAAAKMMEEVKMHIEMGTALKEIVFVGFGDKLTAAFERVAGETFREPP